MKAKPGVARYDGVEIKNCYVKNVSRWGNCSGLIHIATRILQPKSLMKKLYKKYGNENIVIKIIMLNMPA